MKVQLSAGLWWSRRRHWVGFGRCELFEIGVIVGVEMKEKTVEEMEVVNDGLDAVERELMG